MTFHLYLTFILNFLTFIDLDICFVSEVRRRRQEGSTALSYDIKGGDGTSLYTWQYTEIYTDYWV